MYIELIQGECLSRYEQLCTLIPSGNKLVDFLDSESKILASQSTNLRYDLLGPYICDQVCQRGVLNMHHLDTDSTTI